MDGSLTRPVPASATHADTGRIALATDYRPSGSRVFRASQLEARLDRAAQRSLLVAAIQLDTNLVDAALAAFTVLLHRLGRQTDLTIGIVRGQPGSRSSGQLQLTAAGFVQLSFDDETNFASVLAQLRPQGETVGRKSNVVFGETSNRDPEAALAAAEEAPRELALLIEGSRHRAVATLGVRRAAVSARANSRTARSVPAPLVAPARGA
jgi:hypothetical protein